jgi:hypothetical protein
MNPYFIAGGVIAVALAYGAGHWQGDTAGQAKVQQLWDKQAKQLAEEHAAAMAAAREREQELQLGANNDREERNKQLREANARVAALTNVVRERADRPAETSAVSGAAGTGPTTASCTGAGLYRPDGEFLVGEAAAGRECQAFLRECRTGYERLRKKVNGEGG